MKKLNIFLIVTVISTALFSCSQEDNNSFNSDNLVGIWDVKVNKYVNNDNDQVVSSFTVPEGYIYMTFTSNGKAILSAVDDDPDTANYEAKTIDGKNVIIVFDDAQTEKDTFDVDAFNVPNMTLNFKRSMQDNLDTIDYGGTDYIVYLIWDLVKRP